MTTFRSAKPSPPVLCHAMTLPRPSARANPLILSGTANRGRRPLWGLRESVLEEKSGGLGDIRRTVFPLNHPSNTSSCSNPSVSALGRRDNAEPRPSDQQGPESDGRLDTPRRTPDTPLSLPPTAPQQGRMWSNLQRFVPGLAKIRLRSQTVAARRPYGAGLRVSETVTVKIGDIKSDKKCLNIPSGKGLVGRSPSPPLSSSRSSFCEFTAVKVGSRVSW